MGRTKKSSDSRVVLPANENSDFLNDSQIMTNFLKNKVYDKAWNELYANKNLMYLDDSDADDYVTYRMNQGTNNAIKPEDFDETNPSVLELEKKLSKEEIDKAKSYLDNTSAKDVKKYMDTVAADRKKLFDYLSTAKNKDGDLRVKDSRGKETNWNFTNFNLGMDLLFSYKNGTANAQINFVDITRDKYSKKHFLTVDFNGREIVRHKMPVWDNNTFSSKAKLVEYANKFIKTMLL